jgi:hypothetical protein
MTVSTLIRTATSDFPGEEYVDAYEFVDYSLDEVVVDNVPDDQYSWNRYTETTEPDDWDQQNGTYGLYESAFAFDGSSDTYFDLND